MSEEDPILEKARQLRAAGASIEQVRSYLASKGYEFDDPITPGHSKFTSDQLVGRANRSVAQSEDELEAAGGYNPTTHKIMGTAAALARDVPGAEAVQALLSSGVNRIPYRDALSKIREVESDAGAAGTVARIGGGALSAGLIPGSPVLQGARYGIAHGLAQADPDATVEDRLHDAALEGSVGAVGSAVAPKILPFIGKAAKGIASNVAATGDAALTPFSHGARVRTVGRLAGLIREATGAGTRAAPVAANVADDAAAPMVEGYQPISALVERAQTRVLPFPSPTPPAPDAKAQFSALLQKNLDEGMEAAESVKGYPISGDPPPTPPDVLRRIQEALLRAKAGQSGGVATPRRGITTPPRTVADVLKGGAR